MMRDGGLRLLMQHMAPHRRALGMLAAWSMVEAVPALVSGLLVATALDQGFLVRRPFVGVSALLGLVAAQGLAVLATRRLYPCLADTVEPLRDGLIKAVTTACVHRAVANAQAPDGAGTAQATSQVETVRELVALLLRNNASSFPW